MLGVHPKTVIRLFRRHEIPAFRPGGKLWRTSREAVDEYVSASLRAARAARSQMR
jgi:excisionase family DNA binding protein